MAFPEDVFNELHKEVILDYYRPRPIWGLYYELWAQYAKQVGAFIEAHQLQAARIGAAHTIETRDPGQPQLPIWNGGIFGGNRNPHCHFNGAIYPMTNEEWGMFSHEMVGLAASGLRDASHVSFQHASFQAVMECAQAMSKL